MLQSYRPQEFSNFIVSWCESAEINSITLRRTPQTQAPAHHIRTLFNIISGSYVLDTMMVQ